MVKDARCFSKNNETISMTDLYDSSKCSVVEILDAVEDSKTAKELVSRLNNLNLRIEFKIDRTTAEYVRLKYRTSYGSVCYFKAYYDRTEPMLNEENFAETDYGLLAEQFCDAIESLAEKPDNLFNFKCYLSHHFSVWIKKYASTPEDLTAEIKSFANMEV